VTPAATPIQQRFQQLRSQGTCALMPFLMAGDPDLASTRSALLALQVAAVEVVRHGMT
jgi:tryptophan synthase alpha chain